MSAHCARKPSSRRALVCAALGAGAVASPLLMQTDAYAEVPAQASPGDYQQQMNTAAAADEAYDAAVAQAATLQQRIDALQAHISSDTCAMGSLRRSLGLQAALQYEGSGMSGFEIAVDSSPSAYLNNALAGNEIAEQDARILASLAEDEARVAADRRLAAAALAQQQAAVDDARAHKDAALAAVRRAQEIFDDLDAAGRRALAQAGEGLDPGRVHLSDAAPNARAAAAVAYAESKVGDPYVYGSAGPGAFDCSGLTMTAWAQGGVRLPHDAADQASMLSAVDVSQLEPGDLVFYSYDGGTVEHVALYVGDGLVIHSPRPGEDVQYGAVSSVGPIVRVGRVTA